MIKLDNRVVLNPINHIYTDTKTGANPISVSKFFEAFKEPFDRENISWAIARKQLRLAVDSDWYKKYSKAKPGPEPTEEAIKKEKQKVLDEWDRKLKNSQNIGTHLHSIAESILKKESVPPYYKGLKDLLLTHFNQYHSNFSEIILHSEKDGIAGTADDISIRQRSLKSLADICDFKTNVEKGIVFDSIKLFDSGKLKHYNRMYEGPISHIEDCNFNEYSIKISIYAYMLEKYYDFKIGKLFILFIKDNNNIKKDTIGDFEVTYHPVIYMKYTVLAMIEYYKTKFGNQLPKKKVSIDLDDY